MKYTELEEGEKYLYGSINGIPAHKYYDRDHVERSHKLVTLVSLDRYDTPYKWGSNKYGELDGVKPDPKGKYVKVVLHNQTLSYHPHKVGDKEGYLPFTFLSKASDIIDRAERRREARRAAEKKRVKDEKERKARRERLARYAKFFNDVNIPATVTDTGVLFDEDSIVKVLDELGYIR